EELTGWFTGRIPQGWFTGPPEIDVDREEVLIVGTLPDVELGKDTAPEALRAARAGRIKQHREDTREARMAIAREAEHRFRRKVSWGAVCGDERELFTTLSIPVMTRLRMPEREVLDTLVNAGVARSRSHALAWCVKLVAENESPWIDKLREALSSVKQVRSEGPGFGAV
ncbi:MAG TPA: hypothetical protein VKK30_00530, partial [Actinomycetota bacterium]|nr:hypothetical protein [Actinomycetota bacterium]